MSLFSTIKRHAQRIPHQTALHDGAGVALHYQAFAKAIAEAQQHIKDHVTSATIALAMDNSPAWAVMDLAVMANKMPLVPIPPFFSSRQITHAIDDAGVTIFITDNPQQYCDLLANRIIKSVTFTVAGKRLMLMQISNTTKALPKGTCKITYTSGTTGQPKGVCLSEASMLKVATAIVNQASLKADNQHLGILPLAVLLENVAGLYANLLAGGCSYLLGSARNGFAGSQTDIALLMQALQTTQANTAILIPELLSAIVQYAQQNNSTLPALRFLAVGGASVSPTLLAQAQQLGLPVYEGYGLSESASVVALNTIANNKPGSVGKPLPHISIRIADDGAVQVKGANYLGYIGHAPIEHTWLDTGDIGHIDEDGYLVINGRKKNIFITSYGRNVSPEWVERDLTSTPTIAQACLFGEAKPWNTALIVANPKTHATAIDDAIKKINQQLPDYARVSKWLLADEPFTVNNKQLTPNGRLKRDAIWQHYQASIDSMYL